MYMITPKIIYVVEMFSIYADQMLIASLTMTNYKSFVLNTHFH